MSQRPCSYSKGKKALLIIKVLKAFFFIIGCTAYTVNVCSSGKRKLKFERSGSFGLALEVGLDFKHGLTLRMNLDYLLNEILLHIQTCMLFLSSS